MLPESFSSRVPSSASLSPLSRSTSPVSRLPSRRTPCSTPGAKAGRHSEWLAELLRRPAPPGMRTIQIAPHLAQSVPSCEDNTGELARSTSKKLLPRSPSNKLRLAASLLVLNREANHPDAERSATSAGDISRRRAERELHEVEKRRAAFHATHALPEAPGFPLSSTLTMTVASQTAVDRVKVQAYLGLSPESRKPLYETD
ncbi:hypothetical protein T484DRAFT_1825655 [Baffinella frigidus]|nr:hypothetical protein T484DRAFT_1825655 [Cryptophyta sp. CCMP2293]